jgi:cytoskeletal protein RodZ
MHTDTHPLAPAEDNPAAATIGVRLRQLREQKGLELQQVSEETRISTSNLIAIEEEIYDQLPADTFIRGLVTIYGNFLDIDGNEAARNFLGERDRQQPKGKKSKRGKTSHSLTPKKLAEPSNLSSATIAGVLLLFIVISFTAVCLYTGWNPFASFLNQGQSSALPGLIQSPESRDPEKSDRTTAQQVSDPELSLPRTQDNRKQAPDHNPPMFPQSEPAINGD